MNTTSIDVLNMLVEAGLTREKAEPLAKEILTRTEAKEVLATKTDVKQELQAIRADMYKGMLIQTGSTIAGVGVLLAIFELVG